MGLYERLIKENEERRERVFKEWDEYKEKKKTEDQLKSKKQKALSRLENRYSRGNLKPKTANRLKNKISVLRENLFPGSGKRRKKDKINERCMNLLRLFWIHFRGRKTELDKLNFLCEYTDIVLRKRKTVEIQEKRDRFLGNWHYFGMRKGCCRVCSSNKDIIRHHIIQIQNGGNNHFNNLIVLCSNCHNKIHLWLNDKVEDELSKEYLKVVSTKS